MKKGDVGFTLVELLVSIAIVGILASISIAMFKEYRSKSYDSRAIAQVQQAVISLSTTLIDHSDWVCGFLTGFDNTILGYGGGSHTITECLPGFTQDPDVVLQPSINQNISPNNSITAFACSRYGSVASNGDRHWAFINTASGSGINMVVSTYPLPGGVGTIKQHYDSACVG